MKNKLQKIFIRKRRKGESLFKYTMGLVHLWGALLSSLVICTLCITGCIYAFKTQIIDLYNYDKIFIKNEQTSINIDKIEQNFSKQNKKISSIFIPKNKDISWKITYTNVQNQLHTTRYNPYTQTELGTEDDSLEFFFQTILEIHRNLLLGDFGRQIVGISVIIFIILLFSGFVLWIPKKIKHLKDSLTIKFSGKFQRINYDMHRTLGIYSMIFLLIIAITGLYITYPWVKNTIITSLGGESLNEINTPKNNTEDDEFAKIMADMLSQQNEKENTNEYTAPLSKILTETQKHLNYEGNTTINLPNEKSPRYNITKINSENFFGAMLTDEISLDKTGQLKSKDLFSEKPLNKQFTAIARPLHTGEIMGLPSIIFYFFISLIGFLLPITGLMIWWNRVKKQF